MIKSCKKYLLLLMVTGILIGCHRNPLKINVSNEEIDLRIVRLDQVLKSVTSETAKSMVPTLLKEYDPFFTAYNQEILAIGDPRDSVYTGYLMTFMKDSVSRKAWAASDSLYHDFLPYKQQMEQAFKHFHHYFPSLTLPVIYTYISGFNQAIVSTQDAVGISLENYLGAGSIHYKHLGVSEYKRRNMVPEKLAYDAVFAWGNQQFEYKGNTENLVSEMIHQGKLLYFMDAMIPEGEDSLKIGYTLEQLKWCSENEALMWNWLVEKKMLFSTERMAMVRFINPAPFTSAFGQKSPGRTGAWLGWQIVRSYMKKHEAITLQGLMEEKDYHKILNESGYSPD